MKYVLVLEKDPKFQKDIHNVLMKIDPQLQVRFFTALQNFAAWMQSFSKDGPLALAKAGFGLDGTTDQEPKADDLLALIITEEEILGSKHIPLLKKTQAMCIQKKVCTLEDPTAIVMTVFDNPGFELRHVEDRVINNLIFKPFDELILRQHLIFALSGRHPPSEYTIHNMKTTATVEMIKDVNIEAYSEVGFVTRSNREISVGKIAKYYGEIFRLGNQKSMFARCFRCEPHPEFKGDFRVSFTFFGMMANQLSELRRNIAKFNNDPYSYQWVRAVDWSQGNFIVIDDEETGQAGGVVDLITKTFAAVNISKFKTLGELNFALDPIARLKSLKKVPCHPNGASFRLRFDKNRKIMNQDLKDGESIFGYNKERIAQIFLKDVLSEEDIKLMTKILDGTQALDSESIVTVKHPETEFFVRIKDRKAELDKDNKEVIELGMEELTDSEKEEFVRKQSQIPELIHGVFTTTRWIGEDLTQWTELGQKLLDRITDSNLRSQHRPLFFALSKEKKSDVEMRKIGELCAEIFYKPLEKNGLSKKMQFYFPFLQSNIELEISTFKKEDIIQVANPVAVEELSEAGLVMTYYRPISIGSFRLFAFVNQSDTELPVLHSTCNFCQEIEGDEKKYQHHFVFFGIRDEQLKQVRLWLRDNYIQSKTQS